VKTINRFEIEARDRKAAGLANVLEATGLPQATLRRMQDAQWEAATAVLRQLTGKAHSLPSAASRRRALAILRLRRYWKRTERAAGL
jgi:hypothetical protein